MLNKGGIYIFSGIKGFIRNINHNTSIVRKILTLTLCLIFISLLIVSYTYYISMSSIIQNEVKSTYEMIAEQYASSVSYKMNIFENLVSGIATSNSIQKNLSMQQTDYFENIQMNIEINNAIDFLGSGYDYSQINNIKLYFMNPSFDLFGKYAEKMENAEKSDWYKLFDTKKRKLQVLSSPDDKGVLSLVKIISSLQQNNRMDVIGLVKIDINKQNLFKLSDKRVDKIQNLKIFVLDDASKVIYQNCRESYNALGLTDKEVELTDREVGVNSSGISALAVIRNMQYRDFKCIVVFPTDSVNVKIRNAIALILISIISIGAISIFIILIFSSSFAKRLKYLLGHMEKVKKGDFKVSHAIDYNDEIGIVHNNFNEMVEKLNQSINENYVQKLKKREAELKALQFQINPHFLYNTLECINSIAIVNNNMQISKIVLKLGEMLRYNLNNTVSEYVELKEEIKQIHNYVDIQKIRFGDKFSVVFDIPEELENIKILRFILQPVIENFIVHGFTDKKEKGCAEISVHERDGNIEFEIRDDGTGIPEYRLTQINDRLKVNDEWQVDGKKKSIGLQNVNSRIKLAYGEEYGLEITSIENIGTIVKIIIPKM